MKTRMKQTKGLLIVVSHLVRSSYKWFNAKFCMRKFSMEVVLAFLLVPLFAGCSEYGVNSDQIKLNCSDGGECSVADRGPGGGTVVYVSRYLEEPSICIEIFESTLSNDFDWSSAIDAARAHKGGGYSNWRLPTRYEVEHFENRDLLKSGIWTNTDDGNAEYAWIWIGGYLEWDAYRKFQDALVQPIREFSCNENVENTIHHSNSCASGGACSVGDLGPGGGIVFYAPGGMNSWGRYIEAAPDDLIGLYDGLNSEKAADEYMIGGFDNWMVPELVELALLYESRSLVKGLKSADYGAVFPNCLDFETGKGWNPCGGPYRLRLVRHFG